MGLARQRFSYGQDDVQCIVKVAAGIAATRSGHLAVIDKTFFSGLAGGRLEFYTRAQAVYREPE